MVAALFKVIFDTREEHEYHHGVKSPAGGGPLSRPAAPVAYAGFAPTPFEVSNIAVINNPGAGFQTLSQVAPEIVTGTSVVVDSFSDSSMGALIQSNTRLALVHDSYIQDGLLGIVGVDNQATLGIYNDTIDMTYTTPRYNGQTAICLINSLSPVFYAGSSTTANHAGDSIVNNVITSGLGIDNMFRQLEYISNNTITIVQRDSLLNVPTPGISQTSCYGSLITCNTITGFQDTVDSLQDYGIFIDNNNATTLQCNEMNRFGRGIDAQDEQIAYLLDNRIDTCAVGIGVDRFGIIGPQGTNDTSNDNKWIGAYDTSMLKTYNFANGTFSPFYVRTTPGYFNPQTLNKADGNSVLIPIHTVTPSDSLYDCDSSGCPSIEILKPSIYDYALTIIADTISYPSDSIVHRWWSRYNLYVTLQFADTSVLHDSIIVAFIDSYMVSVPGQLLNTQLQMDTSNLRDNSVYNTINDELSAITTTNDMEYNMQYYASWFLNYQRNPFISGNSGTGYFRQIVNYKSTMLDIASQCVFYEGPAVLEARAFMMMDSFALFSYNWPEVCDSSSGSGKRGYVPSSAIVHNDTFSHSDTSSQSLTYKLTPNLFRDNFSASITLGNNEQGEVQIYNIDGVPIESYLVGPGVNQLNLSNPELTGGIYLYKVFVNGQIKTNDKLVVVH